MGWHLAGYPLEHGQARRPPSVSLTGLQFAREAAQTLARRFRLQVIDRDTLARWSADHSRTLYVFDIRQREEYLAGHLRGSRHVEGGQLVQEADRYIAVSNSRVVLVDDTEARAMATASWLYQMNICDVYVLRDGLIGVPLDTGPWQNKVIGLYEAEAHEVQAHELLEAHSKNEISFIDLSISTNYRKGHILGAYFAIRSQLNDALASLSLAKRIVLTSEDGVLARFAAAEMRKSHPTVGALLGGNEAWKAAGGPFDAGNERWTSPAQDVWLKPFDQLHGQVEQRLTDYLKWEVGLLEQVERDGTLRFREMPTEL